MEERKLRRRVLLGLTLGTAGFALLPALPAQAMTLTEYKQALAEGRAFHLDVDDFSSKTVSTTQLASTPEQKKIVRAAGPSGEIVVQLDHGTKLGPAEIVRRMLRLMSRGISVKIGHTVPIIRMMRQIRRMKMAIRMILEEFILLMVCI